MAPGDLPTETGIEQIAQGGSGNIMSCCWEEASPSLAGPVCDGPLALVSATGDADCPAAVGWAGWGVSVRIRTESPGVSRSRGPQMKLIIWFLSSKQVMRSNELFEQRGASRSATRFPNGRDSTEGVAVSPVVMLTDVDGASPGACGAPGSLPGPGQGRGRPACLRYSGHCLHTMYGWLQGKKTRSSEE